MDTELYRQIISDTDNYEKTKDRLFVRLLPENDPRTAGAVCLETGLDFKMLLYLCLSEDEKSLVSARIPWPRFELWERDRKDVFRKALDNTSRKAPFRIYKLEDMLLSQESWHRGKTLEDLEEEDRSLFKAPQGICVSNKSRLNGATAIFYPGIAERLAELAGDDLYLAFTSMHEVMVHAVGNTDPEMLSEVLRETIREATSEADYLTRQICRYSRHRRIIEPYPLI